AMIVLSRGSSDQAPGLLATPSSQPRPSTSVGLGSTPAVPQGSPTATSGRDTDESSGREAATTATGDGLEISITLVPEDARLLVNGVRASGPPYLLRNLRAGEEIDVVADRPGFLDSRNSLVAGKDTAVRIELQRIRPSESQFGTRSSSEPIQRTDTSQGR